MNKTIVYYDRVKNHQNIIHKVLSETDYDYTCSCGQTIHKNDFFLNGELTEQQLDDIKENSNKYHKIVFCDCMI